MKRIVTLLFIGSLCLHLMGQTVAETKVQINKIKRSQSYLSAEATMDTEEAAMNMAKELLVSEINDWVASKKNNASVKQIVLQDINSCTQLMDMKRGVKTRVFVYVKKKDVVLIYGEGQIVLNDEEKKGMELQALDELAQSKPVTSDPGADGLAKLEEDKVVKTESAEEKVIELKSTVENLGGNPLKRIMAVRTMQELKPVFAELKGKGEVTFGVYSGMDSDCYLLFYSRTGEIKGILKQEAGAHKDARTGTPAKITDYNGCGAYWFKLK